MKPEMKKLIIANLPYLLFVYLFGKLGQTYRLAAGADLSEKLLHLADGFSLAFESAAPSFHLFDLAVGVAGAVALRLMVYCKSKNAKKYRRGVEYGSARWGGPKDIAPYIDPVFDNNILLTQTERLTMNNRPKDPKTARNKNVLVIGGSGSGKTRFFVKPNLMQCVSKDYPTSFVITDPKGSLIGEVGQLLVRCGYRVKVLNTINFSKSMRYNPFRYIHSEKDILKLVNTLICNTKGEGEKSAEDFWIKSERLLYSALIGYIWYEAPDDEMNFTIDGVTDIIVARQSLYASIKTDVNQNSGICDTLTGQNYAMIEAALTAGTMPTDSHSIVIHDKIVAHFEDMGVGSTVEFSSVDGKKSIPVTISGVFSTSKMPVIYGHGRAHTDGSVFFAPKDLFRELHPEITTFDYSWSIVSDPKKDETVKAELKNIVAEHSNLALDEIDTAIAAEKSQNSVAFGSMQVLSWLVFLFGVINLINTTLSNQMSRKQENSVLRSIGLTQKQLCKMNICEGLCYAFFATLAILIVGLPISVVVSREMGSATLHGKVVPYQFPVLEMGLFILVLFGMELILSVWTVRRQKKQSLIEQMRAME